MPKRLLRHVDGKRGQFLLVGSGAFTAIGASYILVTTESRSKAFSWLPLHLGPGELGWVWVAVGLFGLFVGALSKCLPPKFNSVAYGALITPPVLWAVVFLIAWVIGAHPLGWVSAISYALMAGWILVVSDWPNPARLPSKEDTAEMDKIVQQHQKEPHEQ